MTRLTPRATLFPYTTLFRSYEKPKEKQQIEKTVALENEAKILLDNGLGTKTEPVPAKEGKLSDLTEGLVINIQLSGYDRDRKSTRLNSSHQIISYAVFCLKK